MSANPSRRSKMQVRAGFVSFSNAGRDTTPEADFPDKSRIANYLASPSIPDVQCAVRGLISWAGTL